MWAVMKKELKSYFYSPIGYVFIGLFLAIFSFIFYITTISQGAVTYQYVFFYSVMYIVIFLIPLLTMRTFAEERKNGTEQLLLTSPRSITEIVLGKFLAGVSVIVITLIFSLIYYAILCFFKAPNLVPTLVMILGFLLVGMAAISIGMFISSLTENQIISAVVTIVFFVSSWFLPNLNDNFSIIDLMSNYQKFPAGLISMSEVVNLLGITVVFILFTIIIMQRKKSIK